MDPGAYQPEGSVIYEVEGDYVRDPFAA